MMIRLIFSLNQNEQKMSYAIWVADTMLSHRRLHWYNYLSFSISVSFCTSSSLVILLFLLLLLILLHFSNYPDFLLLLDCLHFFSLFLLFVIYSFWIFLSLFLRYTAWERRCKPSSPSIEICHRKQSDSWNWNYKARNRRSRRIAQISF